MLEKIKRNLDEGLDRIQWLASLLSERIKVEIAVIKLFRESSDLEKRRDRGLRKIGWRVFEFRSQGDVNVFEDGKVRAALKEVEKLDHEINELRQRVAEISAVEEEVEEE